MNDTAHPVPATESDGVKRDAFLRPALPSDLSAREILGRMSRGNISTERYVIECIDRHHSSRDLNAVISLNEESALRSARSIDQQRDRKSRLGAIAGMPILVKDNIEIEGEETASASPGLRNNVPAANAPAIERLLDEGALILGRANMHELAAGVTSINPYTGTVRNPSNPMHIAGGSSGGCAAAISAGIVSIAIGTDTGGSVRIPAAFCGVVGFRPSLSAGCLYQAGGIVPLSNELDTIGPMARTVEDIALVHSIIAQKRIPTLLSLAGIRIGIPRYAYWEALDSEVLKVCEEFLLKLKSLEVTLLDIDVGSYYSLASDVFGDLLYGGLGRDMKKYLAESGSSLSIYEVVESIASTDVRELFERALDHRFRSTFAPANRNSLRSQSKDAYQEMFSVNQLAAIVFPTSPATARPICGEIVVSDSSGYPEYSRLLRNTHVTACLGAPGLSIPIGIASKGLPVGIEFDGLPGSDENLLAIGLAVERAVGPFATPLSRNQRKRTESAKAGEARKA